MHFESYGGAAFRDLSVAWASDRVARRSKGKCSHYGRTQMYSSRGYSEYNMKSSSTYTYAKTEIICVTDGPEQRTQEHFIEERLVGKKEEGKL